MTLAVRVYRQLARAFPHEFKLAYGAEVLQLGEDVLERIAHRHGVGGLLLLLADIAIRVPVEYLSEMRRDMRYALRAMIKSPGFTLVSIISMGLGMGLTTSVYNSKWQLISRDLPAATNAKRLVIDEKPVSYYYIEQYREQKNLFSGVAAIQTGIPFNVVFANDLKAKPERVFGQLVSADYFSVLGVSAQSGRVLSPELDRAGDAPMVVISDRFWRNRLNSATDVVGHTLRLNGQLATIVGITPKDFNGALSINPSELFVPITVPSALAPELADDVLHQRHARAFNALLCLAPGVSEESAEVALDAMVRRLDEQDPSAPRRIDQGRRVSLLQAGGRVPLPKKLKVVLLGFFFVLMGLIMTLACMNLANMLLARGANRRKELAIRLSVGASRFRLVRQMISEGMLLSMFGGVAGFALAYLLAILNSRFLPPEAIPVESDFTPDWHVVLFVFVLAILCGIAFSLVPALRATVTNVMPALKQGGAQQLMGYRRLGLRNLLIVAQVAGSLMLLLITGFLVIGLNERSRVQIKVDSHSVYLFSLDPMRDGYMPEQTQAFFEKFPDRIKTETGVRNVALAAQAPFWVDEDAAIQVTTDDSRAGAKVQISAAEQSVGAGYFAALNEAMLAGREFVDQGQRGSGDTSIVLPAILNESAARGLFGTEIAVGRRLNDQRQSYEVVGVVADERNTAGISQSIVYLPLTARNFMRPPVDGITVLVGSDAGTDPLAGIQREVEFLGPKISIFNVRTLHDYLEASRASTRFAIGTYGGIGMFGLVLAAVGLAGVTAYAVAQRRKEIGIRMALGAQKRQVLGLVLREGTALVGVGTLFGFLGAFVVAKMLSSLTSIFADSMKIGTNDPRLLAGAPLILATLAMVACYLPARRATAVDPLSAVREE